MTPQFEQFIMEKAKKQYPKLSDKEVQVAIAMAREFQDPTFQL